MSVVNEAIEDGVGVSGIADNFVPAVDGELGSDHRGAASVAFLEDFQQIVPGGGVERFQAPIIKDQKVGAAEIAQPERGSPAFAAIFRGVSAGLSGAALRETIAVAVHLEDVDMVGDAIE
jgi:hypothetical protein